MNEQKLYEDYGKAMVDLELAQVKVNQIKQAIVEMLNSQNQAKKEEKVKE